MAGLVLVGIGCAAHASTDPQAQEGPPSPAPAPPDSPDTPAAPDTPEDTATPDTPTAPDTPPASAEPGPSEAPAASKAPTPAAPTPKPPPPATPRARRPPDPGLKSRVALVFDEAQKMVLYSKQAADVAPIASITKLMTAMVVLDAHLPPDQWIAIAKSDVDQPKRTRSRLMVGSRLRRDDLLRVALMASDNRAAAALARNYPGGAGACIAAMNAKAKALGMAHTRFIDASGLSSENRSTAVDLARLVQAAGRYPEIREATTSWSHAATLGNGQVLEFHNSNGLVSNPTWTIGLSKTGYINEAGRCLVMQAEIAARPVIIVLLDSWGKYTRLGDANRIRRWMESIYPQPSGASLRPAGGSAGVQAGS